MSKPVLLVTRQLPSAIADRAARRFHVRVDAADTPRTGTDVVRLARDADAVLCCLCERPDREAIRALPDSVHAVAVFSAGCDHLDHAAARHAEVRGLLAGGAGQWQGWTSARLPGARVSWRRLGTVGMGRIGRELARVARGFDMEVHCRNRPCLTAELERGALPRGNEAWFLRGMLPRMWWE